MLWLSCYQEFVDYAREAAKKVIFSVARPLRPYTPPPLDLSGLLFVWIFTGSVLKLKFFFFLVARPLPFLRVPLCTDNIYIFILHWYADLVMFFFCMLRTFLVFSFDIKIIAIRMELHDLFRNICVCVMGGKRFIPRKLNILFQDLSPVYFSLNQERN